MKLDRAAAEASLAPLASELGLSIEDAAYSIYTTSNNVMVGLIEDMTVKEGINPRESQLVVGGGATASHICEIANELRISDVLCKPVVRAPGGMKMAAKSHRFLLRKRTYSGLARCACSRSL
ncbi:hypothetical protein ASC96_12095 [Rhizobium sp. Root1204]|nr:hypothetical protein ASC96_12095 [Rhizobium sp. Root1204]